MRRMTGMKIRALALALMLSATACGTKANSDRKDAEDVSGVSDVRIEEGTEQGTEQGTTATGTEESGTTDTEEKNTTAGEAGENKEPSADKAAVKEPQVSLSGNASDVIRIEENSYYEGDRFVLYFGKGTTIHGDIAKQIEKVMKDEEDLLGLKYEKTAYLAQTTQPDFRKEELGDSFNGVNPEREKVDILIVKYEDDGAVQWSDVNTILLYDTDFGSETGAMCTVYHEMGHVLRLRQSPHLGSILEEGIGSYTEDMLSRKNGIADWSLVQYYDAGNSQPLYDASEIEKDPEKLFREINNASRSAEQPEYAYGIRLIHFLRETYGEDVVRKLSETAAGYGFESKDTDTILKILKETTSEDVFERFGKWLPEGWKNWCAGYKDYMNSLGFEF